MKDIFQYLPENIVRGEREGFIKREGAKETVLSNAVPVVIKRSKNINHKTNTIQNLIRIQYQTHDNTWIGEAKDFSEEDIMSGKFMKALPIGVVTGMSESELCFGRLYRHR